jgi:hypothetical protein
MSLRFRRRIKLLPGVHINLGLHGAGPSIGPRGVHVGLSRRGAYTSAGIPGTGLYAVHHYRTGEEHHEVRGGCGALFDTPDNTEVPKANSVTCVCHWLADLDWRQYSQEYSGCKVQSQLTDSAQLDRGA